MQRVQSEISNGEIWRKENILGWIPCQKHSLWHSISHECSDWWSIGFFTWFSISVQGELNKTRTGCPILSVSEIRKSAWEICLYIKQNIRLFYNRLLDFYFIFNDLIVVVNVPDWVYIRSGRIIVDRLLRLT